MARAALLTRRLFLAGALLQSISLTACKATQQGDALQRARREQAVRVGFANEAPFGFTDSTGRLTGEAPEVLRALLGRLGIVRLDGVLTEFGSLIPGLNAGRFDIVAAGMAITPQRCARVLFSEPTYSVGTVLAVRDGNPLRLATFEQVADNTQVRLGLLGGSASIQDALHSGVRPEQINTFPDMPTAVAALRAGRTDAIVGTSLTFRDMLQKVGRRSGILVLPNFTHIRGRSVISSGAFAFRLADRAFRETLNAELIPFIGSPDHLSLVRPFGFGRDTLPIIRTEQACAIV
jgi:polar amino acid transport system substrate-binding protein